LGTKHQQQLGSVVFETIISQKITSIYYELFFNYNCYE